jgi:hypothetical protein
MMSDAYHVAQQGLDKKDKTMATRDAGLTKEQVETAEVHAAGSSHCGEIKSKSKSAFSRYSTVAGPHSSVRPQAHFLCVLCCLKRNALNIGIFLLIKQAARQILAGHKQAAAADS